MELDHSKEVAKYRNVSIGIFSHEWVNYIFIYSNIIVILMKAGYITLIQQHGQRLVTSHFCDLTLIQRD